MEILLLQALVIIGGGFIIALSGILLLAGLFNLIKFIKDNV
jgi:hypothetical protein